jgi:hypothetical protein
MWFERSRVAMAQIIAMRLEEYRRDDSCRDADQLDQSVRDWEHRNDDLVPTKGDSHGQ